MSDKIQITVDGKPFEAESGTMLLDAVRGNGVSIPTLCHHPSLDPNGACRLCMVEVTREDWNGWSKLVTSCNYPVEDGLLVSTESDRVKDNRKTLLELYLARCPEAKDLRELAQSEGVDVSTFPVREGADKCVHCGLCTRVCQELGPAAIAPLNRGTDKLVGPRPDLNGEDCTACGACAHVCPTGEIVMGRDNGQFQIWNRSFDIPLCKVKPELCKGVECGECLKSCPFDIPKFVVSETGKQVSYIDPELCTGCGSCAGACPADAIEQDEYPDSLLTGMELDRNNLKGRAVVYACSRSPLPEDTPDVIHVPCIGRVSIEHLLEVLARDAAGVMLMCRDQETCPYAKGGALGQMRAEVADAQAYEAGLGIGRIMYVQPKPGLDGPADAVAAFRATHSDSPLKVAYPGSKTGQIGMDHALEIKEWMKHQPGLKPSRTVSKRTITQAISLVLLHSSLWDWAQLKWFCNPVLSCHSCALSWFACPVGVFVHYSGYHAFPFVAVGTVLLLGVLFARLLCGWVCPFGFLQDLLYKIPTKKFTLPAWTSNIKYGVLILGVFLLPFFLGEQTAFSFCRICPAAALQSTIPNMITTGVGIVTVLVVVKLGTLAFFLVLTTLSKRAFCKAVCPIGAMLAPLNMISFFKIKTPPKSCINCNWCDKVCPASGTPSSRVSKDVPANRVMDCIYCYECKDACPMHGPVEVDLKKQGKLLQRNQE